MPAMFDTFDAAPNSLDLFHRQEVDGNAFETLHRGTRRSIMTVAVMQNRVDDGYGGDESQWTTDKAAWAVVVPASGEDDLNIMAGGQQFLKAGLGNTNSYGTDTGDMEKLFLQAAPFDTEPELTPEFIKEKYYDDTARSSRGAWFLGIRHVDQISFLVSNTWTGGYAEPGLTQAVDAINADTTNNMTATKGSFNGVEWVPKITTEMTAQKET